MKVSICYYKNGVPQSFITESDSDIPFDAIGRDQIVIKNGEFTQIICKHGFSPIYYELLTETTK